MKSLDVFLNEANQITIHTLAEWTKRYIEEHWQPVLQASQVELERLFDAAGEGAAYGAYATKLLRPIGQQLKQSGYATKPSFPGTLSMSREWGPLRRRERWMWSMVNSTQEKPLGALVVLYYHDHTRFRIPCMPDMLALEKTDSAAIVNALSQASTDFENAEA